MENENFKNAEVVDDKRRGYTSLKRIVTGVIILIAGVLMLFRNLDMLNWQFENIVFSWEMLLIAIGFISLAGRNYTSAIILFSIGLFFLIPNFFTFDIDFIQIFWPTIIIIVGLSMLLKHGALRNIKNKRGNSEDVIDEINIFGGAERIINSEYFEGGKITCVFGGSTVNLKDVKLKNGTAEIELTAIFGGAKIIVPDNWNIKVEAMSIFGGINDKRTVRISDEPSYETLIIRGTAIFGGAEIFS